MRPNKVRFWRICVIKCNSIWKKNPKSYSKKVSCLGGVLIVFFLSVSLNLNWARFVEKFRKEKWARGDVEKPKAIGKLQRPFRLIKYITVKKHEMCSLNSKKYSGRVHKICYFSLEKAPRCVRSSTNIFLDSSNYGFLPRTLTRRAVNKLVV